MANGNSITPPGYRFKGKAFPLSSLTSDPRILSLAERLHEQGSWMADAHQNSIEFEYRPIRVHKDLRHVFG